MAVAVTKFTRVFKYNGATFPDPDPNMSAEEVKDLLSAAHPDLTNAELSEPVVNGNKLTYSFVRQVGTKG